MAKAKGVGAGTSPVASDAHTTQAVYHGDEIALGITCQLQIGERRSIVIQTHTVQSVEPKELNALFDKIWTAADRINARYRLKELLLNKKMQQDQMAMIMDNNAQTRAKWEKEWGDANRGRRGPFSLNAQQHNLHQQQQTQIERHKNEIAALETEIKDTERLIAAG
jgi:hypothetical protein